MTFDSRPFNFGQLVGQFPQAILLYDRELRLLYLNNPAQRFFKGKLAEQWANWIKHEGNEFYKQTELSSKHFNNEIDLERFHITFSPFQNQSSFQLLIQIFTEDAKEVSIEDNDEIRSQKLFALKYLSSGIAHHINNPLSVIMGYNELLSHRISEGQPPQKLQYYLDEQKKAVKRIAHTSKLLSIFSIQDHWKCSEVNLHQCLQEVLQKINHNLPTEEVQIKTSLCDFDLIVNSSSIPLKQALEQIILNAKEISSSASQITSSSKVITIETTERNGVASIIVRDQGGGISKSTLPHIFNPFYSTKETGEGLGLGLSVAHTIIENLGGRLLLQSFLNQGTRFEICLPLQNLEEKKTCPLWNKRVLLVGDEAEIQNLLIMHLQEMHFEVECTPDAYLAIERLLQNSYEVIIADLFLNEMKGVSFLEKTKSLPHLAQSQIYFLSPEFLTECSHEEAKILREKSHGFISKPFSKRELSQLLLKKP